MSDRTQDAIQQLQREAEELSMREHAASARRQELAALADEVAGRVASLDGEVKTVIEMLARGLMDGKPFDPTMLARLEDTRQALRLEFPVRRRAAELATQQLTALQQQL